MRAGSRLAERSWPLFGYFAVAFAMLFVLDVGLLTDRAVRSDRSAIAIIVANAVALAAVGVGLAKQVDTYAVQYLDRRGLLAWITSRGFDPFGPGVCELSRPYLGRWRVVTRTSPEDSRLFASRWIDLKYDLTFDAGDSPWSPSEWSPTRAGRWGPGEWGGPFWLSLDGEGYSTWHAILRDGQLLLDPWEEDDPPHWPRPPSRFGFTGWRRARDLAPADPQLPPSDPEPERAGDTLRESRALLFGGPRIALEEHLGRTPAALALHCRERVAGLEADRRPRSTQTMQACAGDVAETGLDEHLTHRLADCLLFPGPIAAGCIREDPV